MNTIRDYRDSVHFAGRIWSFGALLMMLMVPAAICIYYNAWPEFTAVLKGFVGVAPILSLIHISPLF